jgi:hypothetical protein
LLKNRLNFNDAFFIDGDTRHERYAKRCGEIKTKAPVAAQSGQIYRRNLRA